jgi:uncharacterized protein (TIGR02449 family)
MDELFKRLERQIKSLLDQHDQLRVANSQLQQSKHVLVRDKEDQLDRQKRAITTIESLITKLKAIEKGI